MNAPAVLDEEAIKVGLLLETAQSQQRLIASSLKQLKGHTQELDNILREQIHRTLCEQFGALVEESAAAVQTLHALKHAAGLRFGTWIVVTTLVVAAITLLSAWWLLPSRSQIDALRARQTQLNASIANLEQRGGLIELRRCGAGERWCVRIDRQAPVYGEQADYYVVKGY